jgi:hypothetical protein
MRLLEMIDFVDMLGRVGELEADALADACRSVSAGLITVTS